MNIKNTVILAFFTAFLNYSCQREFDFSLDPHNNQTYKVKEETLYCESEPENEIGLTENTYDSHGNLILSLKKTFGSNQSMTEIEYNHSDIIICEKRYYFSDNEWKLNHTYEYKYSDELLQEKIKINQDGEKTNKIIYLYRGRKPEWEDFFRFSEGDWVFSYGHKFDFNGNGQLVKKSSYKTKDKNEVYDYFTYTYKNGKLSEEERILITGKVGYHKDYFYNHDGTLDYVTEDGNMVEENFYEKGKLTEKHTWYYGIDPGFSLCSGNIIYRYEY